MSQLFRPGANTIARLSVLAGLLLLALGLGMLLVRNWSPYVITGSYAGVAVEQPVLFSHQLHSDQLNIECTYCHYTAEKTEYGGIPDTHTCMSCHEQIATYSELLAPVRQSYAENTPLIWYKVHDLAEHVYFNHSAHVANGFACETCHGPVNEMPQVWQAEKMYMGWCLECHLEPEKYIRPLDERYTFGYEVENQIELGLQLIDEYNVNVEGLTTCSTCHH